MIKHLWQRNNFNMSKRTSMKGHWQYYLLVCNIGTASAGVRTNWLQLTSKERHFRQKHVITESIFLMNWHLQIVKNNPTSKTFVTVLNILQQLLSLLFALEKYKHYQSDIKIGKVATFGNRIRSELFKKWLSTQHIMIWNLEIFLFTECRNYMAWGWVASRKGKILPKGSFSQLVVIS